VARERIAGWVGASYLAGRDELQRAQRALQVGHIVLEVSQRLRRVSKPAQLRDSRITCVGDAGLDLGGVLPRRAVGGDLVQRVGHVGGDVEWLSAGLFEVLQLTPIFDVPVHGQLSEIR
jgi:hypothetical protein